MHELSLMAAVVEQIEALSHKERFNHVSEIRLSVGILCGVDSACLEFCFSEATRRSVLDGAKLIIEIVPLELICKSCSKVSFTLNPAQLVCSFCGANHVSIGNGREFKIIDLEVESNNSMDINGFGQALIN